MFAMLSAFDLNKIADSFWGVMFNDLLPMSPLKARRHRLRASREQAIGSLLG
jgi:hypothetical protein